MRTGSKRLIPALIVAVGGLSLLPAASVQADTITALPITSFYQIVADTAHGHLFISQGSSSRNEIIVTDLSGQEVTTITGQTGVTGIALSPDGSTLYAALGGGHAVTAIDTTTLQQTASYPVGDANTPVDVAVQSGKVWVSYNSGTPSSGAIGDIDLTATSPAFETQAAMGGWSSAPQIAADPSDTGVLVAAEPGSSPSSVASYDVSVDPATVRAQSTFFTNCENEMDVAVVPGGSQFILACGWPYAHFRYSTTDLSQQGSYGSTNYPGAVAIASNGDVAAGTVSNPYQPDIYVYQPNADTPLNTFSPPSSGADLVSRGLAWSADTSELFAVLGTTSASYSLQVIDYPTLTQSALSLTGPSTAVIGTSVTMTGTLSLNNGTAPPAGTPISIARSVAGGTGVQDFNVTTAAGGSFTLTDTPPAPGQYTYTASYSGTASIAPATASLAVTVTLKSAVLTLATGPKTFTYEPTVHVTAHLGTTDGNRTLSIYAQPFGSTTKVLLKTGRVDANGNLAVSYAAPHSTTFSVVFAGDAFYAPKTVTRAIFVRAKVSESISGYYSSKRIGRTTYRLYHRSGLLHATGTVSPNKHGQCGLFEVQEFFQRAWHENVVTSCGQLNRSSKVFGTFKLTKADIGYHYRIRAIYLRSSKDTSNLSNASGWQYLIVEP